MNFRRSVVLAIAVMLMSVVSFSARAEDVEGLVTRVPGKNYKYDGKKVEVIEFLSFYCGHCYAFEAEIPKIKGNFPKKVSWKVYPVYWGEGSSKPGEAYLLAVDSGKGDEMKREIFRASFIDKSNIGDMSVLEELGKKAGLGFDFSRRLRSGEKFAEAKAAIDMAMDYKVSSTPTVIVAGNMSVNAVHDTAEYRKNVIKVIGSVLKK